MKEQQDVISRIQKLMKERGLSKTVFAEKIGISRNTLYSWFLQTENKRNMKDHTIRVIAEYLGVSFEYLKYGKTYEPVLNRTDFVEIPVVANLMQAHTTPELPTIPYNLSFLKHRGLDKKQLFVLKVIGSSWSPIVCQNDLLLIDERELVGNLNRTLCVCVDEKFDYTISCISKDFITNSVTFYDLSGNLSRQSMNYTTFKSKVKKCMKIVQIIRNVI